MTIARTQDVTDEIQRISDVVGVGIIGIQSALRSGQAGEAELAGFQVLLSTASADLLALRDEVGALDVTGLELVPDAESRIELWGWQVGALSQFRKVAAQILEARSIAAQLRSGRRPRTHVVIAGETLQSIAADVLGDWREWERLLDANGLDPAAVLTPGVELVVPERR
ncbi:MAG: LysM domain-containing protein [Myxococcota bacterium]